MAEPHRFRAPHWCGLRLGSYLLGVELLVVVLPVMYTLRQSGLVWLLAASAALYAALFTGAASLLGLIPWLRRRPLVLLAVLLAGVAGADAAAGDNVIPLLLFGLPALAMAMTGTHLAGRPSRLRFALRTLVIVVFGGALVPLAVPVRRPPPPVPPPPSAGAPDVVLIVLDTVRRDHLSTYGHGRETSPALTALAARGARFDDARVNGVWSLPSHATLFTGEAPSTHGAHYEHWLLDDDLPTLAEALAATGYETVCVTGNPLISRGLGTARGFRVVDESWRSFWVQESLIAWRMLRPLWDRDRDKGGAAGVRFLRRWLRRERDPERPLFLFVNVMDSHAPYTDVPPAYQRRFLPEGVSRSQARRLVARVFVHHVFGRALELDDAQVETVTRSYDGAVAYADAVLGQILDALAGDGGREDTLVIVLADHGELLGEHALWGHVHSLYDELLRVPLVMAWPGHVAPGTVIDSPVDSLDVVATIQEAAGVPGDLRVGHAGADLLSPEPLTPDPIVAEHFVPSMLPDGADVTMSGDLDELFVRRRCLIAGDLKYMVSSSGDERLFDLAADPGELVDVQPRRPDDVTVARAMMAAWIEEEDAAWSDEPAGGGAGPEIDEATRRRLRDLGYLE